MNPFKVGDWVKPSVSSVISFPGEWPRGIDVINGEYIGFSARETPGLWHYTHFEGSDCRSPSPAPALPEPDEFSWTVSPDLSVSLKRNSFMSIEWADVIIEVETTAEVERLIAALRAARERMKGE